MRKYNTTKRERNVGYRKMLRAYVAKYSLLKRPFGFCALIRYGFPSDKYNIALADLPEIWKHNPNNGEPYWFPTEFTSR